MEIFRMKYEHNLRVYIDRTPAILGLSVEEFQIFITTSGNIMNVFDSDSCALVNQIEVPIEESVTREPNEIIGLSLSAN